MEVKRLLQGDMSGTEERRKSARQRRVKLTAHSSALESLRAAREGRESRAEQHDVRNLAVFSLVMCSILALCFSAGTSKVPWYAFW